MLREKALEILEEHSPYGVPLENHCRRLAEFALALGETRRVELDEDLIWAAAYLHDIGLCVKDPDESNYLKRGLKFALPLATDWGLDEEQLKVFSDVMLYSHSLKEVPGMSVPGEMVRLGVRVEHSMGRMGHGLSSSFCREVFLRYPRRGFNRVLFAFFKTVVAEDGPSELYHIFFPAVR